MASRSASARVDSEAGNTYRCQRSIVAVRFNVILQGGKGSLRERELPGLVPDALVSKRRHFDDARRHSASTRMDLRNQSPNRYALICRPPERSPVECKERGDIRASVQSSSRVGSP